MADIPENCDLLQTQFTKLSPAFSTQVFSMPFLGLTMEVHMTHESKDNCIVSGPP